jgi:hypothetical protein
MLVVSSMALEPGLTAREKQFVSECQAARYDIVLLSAKVPEKPVVAGEAVTLVDLALTLGRMEMVIVGQSEQLATVSKTVERQEQEMSGLRRQVAEMAAAATAAATRAPTTSPSARAAAPPARRASAASRSW